MERMIDVVKREGERDMTDTREEKNRLSERKKKKEESDKS